METLENKINPTSTEITQTIADYYATYKSLIEHFEQIDPEVKNPGTNIKCTLIEISSLIKDVPHFLKIYQELTTQFLKEINYVNSPINQISYTGNLSILRAAAQLHTQTYGIEQKKPEKLDSILTIKHTPDPKEAFEEFVKKLENATR